MNKPRQKKTLTTTRFGIGFGRCRSLDSPQTPIFMRQPAKSGTISTQRIGTAGEDDKIIARGTSARLSRSRGRDRGAISGNEHTAQGVATPASCSYGRPAGAPHQQSVGEAKAGHTIHLRSSQQQNRWCQAYLDRSEYVVLLDTKVRLVERILASAVPQVQNHISEKPVEECLCAWLNGGVCSNRGGGRKRGG